MVASSEVLDDASARVGGAAGGVPVKLENRRNPRTCQTHNSPAPQQYNVIDSDVTVLLYVIC